MKTDDNHTASVILPYFEDIKNESSSNKELRKCLYNLGNDCFELSNELRHEQRLRDAVKQ